MGFKYYEQNQLPMEWKTLIDKDDVVFVLNDLIDNNINIDNIKLFNEYKIGGYLLFKGIPVFYDSRADLYDTTFNGKEVNIFEDGTNAEYGRCDYRSIFDKYGITHVIAKKNQVLYIILEKDEHINLIYEDKYFSLYEVK